jgi:hypothetical protein
MLALLRYRRSEFDITCQVIKAAMRGVRRSISGLRYQLATDGEPWNSRPVLFSHDPWKPFRNSTTNMVLLILRHTDDKDLSGIVSETGFLRYAEFYMSTDILQHLRNRLEENRHEIDILCLLARLKRLICLGGEATETDDLIQELTAYRDEWLSSACNDLFMLAVNQGADRVVNGLLEQSLADVNYVGPHKHTPPTYCYYYL